MSEMRTGTPPESGVTARARRRRDSALIAGEVGTFEWDVAADHLWGDANFERLFGIELDATGVAPLDEYLAAIHPEDRPQVRAEIQRVLDTGEAYEAEYRIERGGEVRWVIARAKVERGPDGQVARMPGVVLDITERKRMEGALRASEAKYRALFDAIDEGFCVIEMIFDGDRAVDYRFVEGNPAWEEHTGLQGALGKTAREVLPDLEEHWFRIYGEIARSGEPVRFVSGSDVMGRWFDVYAFPVEHLGPDRVALLFKDISEQKRTQEELTLSRERFRTVLESALDAAYRRDLRTDSYDYLSPRVEQVLGIDAKTMRSLPIHGFDDRVHPEDRDAVRRAIEKGERSGRGRIEYRFRGDDGEYRWLADHFTLQTDDEGTAIYRTGIVRDASQRKQAEVALEEAREAAEEASRAKSRFLAVMSHELRTPLTGIVGFADLLESGVLGEVSERQTNSLARIKASAWHLVGIIDEILDLSRAEAGNEPVRSEETDVAELAREVVNIVEPDAAERGIELHCVDADLPALVSTDAGKVRQILINLVGNAVKYTDGDRVDVIVNPDEPSCLRIHVRDQGPGIPATEHERIFEPFTQLDSSHTRPGSGTGLGLAICRRLARLLDGDVTLESEVGAGTTFTLELPSGR